MTSTGGIRQGGQFEGSIRKPYSILQIQVVELGALEFLKAVAGLTQSLIGLLEIAELLFHDVNTASYDPADMSDLEIGSGSQACGQHHCIDIAMFDPQSAATMCRLGPEEFDLVRERLELQ